VCYVTFLAEMEYEISNTCSGKEGILLIISFNHLRESLISRRSLHAELLISVMPIVISDFYTMINLYIIRLTIVKRRNSDTDFLFFIFYFYSFIFYHLFFIIYFFIFIHLF